MVGDFMKKYNSVLKNGIFTLIVLAASFAVSIILHNVLSIEEHVTTLFVFAVFIISLFTEGYVYGVVACVASVLAVNFAFTFPYFSFNFTIAENLLSAIIMVVLSLLTSMLTTRLKEWESIRKASELEKMRANLMRAMSHDIRTPLTTIYGSSSAMLDNYKDFSDSQKLKMIGGIKEDSEWLIRIVENLLSVTKLDGGRLKLIKTPIAVDELIDSVYLEFQKRYPDTKISLSLPDSVVLIPMDPLLIEQVVINLLENAVQHAKGMTNLELNVNVRDGRAIFEVLDDGCGIEKDRLQRIFEGNIPPSQSVSDGKKKNAGIGLSVCASIIKAHGGEIHAENKTEGGAKFCFALDIEDRIDEQ